MECCAQYHEGTEGGHLSKPRAGGEVRQLNWRKGASTQNRENAGLLAGNSVR